ncbi:hypothetical protein GGR75_001372 [Xanthomonas campestris]|nr:hypothetical protein [Xanthomonas campestris]
MLCISAFLHFCISALLHFCKRMHPCIRKAGHPFNDARIAC